MAMSNSEDLQYITILSLVIVCIPKWIGCDV